MDIRPLTPGFAVSPQIEPGDAAAIAAAGYNAVICNRPDGEVPPELQAEAVRAAAEAAGLRFVLLPIERGGLTPELAERQRAAAAEGGRALAYCASGTRSATAWALGAAGSMPAEEILSRTAAAGYDLGHLRPHLAAGG